MRAKEEIMKSLIECSPDYRPSPQKALVEVLLDIRDLLIDQKYTK